MSQTTVFDQEIPIFMSIASTSNITNSRQSPISKQIMLRLYQDTSSESPVSFDAAWRAESNKSIFGGVEPRICEDMMSFTIELYDELDVSFLYTARFSRSKFAEIKQAQCVEFDVEKAPEKIINFVNKLNQSNLNFINCTIENNNKDKSICKFELMNRGELKNSAQLTLELSRAQGTQLMSHLNDFNKKYKQRLDTIEHLKKLNAELQTEFDNHKRKFKQKEREFEEECQKLKADFQDAREKIQEQISEIQKLEEDRASINSKYDDLKSAYLEVHEQFKTKQEEYDTCYDDNLKLVEEMEAIEYELTQLQTQNKKNIIRVKDLERKNYELNNENGKFLKKAELCENNAKEYKKRSLQFKEEILTLETHLENLKLNKTEQQQKLEQLQKDFDEKNIELENMKINNENLEKQLKEAEMKLKRYKIK